MRWKCLSLCSGAWLPKFDSTLEIWADWPAQAVRNSKIVPPCSGARNCSVLSNLGNQAPEQSDRHSHPPLGPPLYVIKDFRDSPHSFQTVLWCIRFISTHLRTCKRRRKIHCIFEWRWDSGEALRSRAAGCRWALSSGRQRSSHKQNAKWPPSNAFPWRHPCNNLLIMYFAL